MSVDYMSLHNIPNKTIVGGIFFSISHGYATCLSYVILTVRPYGERKKPSNITQEPSLV